MLLLDVLKKLSSFLMCYNEIFLEQLMLILRVLALEGVNP